MPARAMTAAAASLPNDRRSVASAPSQRRALSVGAPTSTVTARVTEAQPLRKRGITAQSDTMHAHAPTSSAGADLALAATCGIDLRPAMRLLHRAFAYAADVRASQWQFAVAFERLCACGLNECDLRWLVCRGVIEQGREGGAAEPPRGTARFGPEACFVLTDLGARFARQMLAPEPTAARVDAVPADEGAAKPVWDAARRMLLISGRVVKHFRVPAPSQEIILNAFAEEDWAPRVDDPLPPEPETDPKRRVQSAIMCLNRNQRARLIRFRGDGTGTGILWELVRSA